MSERFARLKTDPRFRRLKKHANKVEIDPRFKILIEDKPGKRAAKIDKYGRKVSGSHEADTLRRFYRLPEDGQPKVDYARGEGLVESSSEEDEEPETDEDGDVVLGGNVNKPISVLAEEVEIDLDESQFAALDAEAEGNLALSGQTDAGGGVTTKPTKRLAAVNLDWDHVKAGNLFKIFASQLTLVTSNEKNQNSLPSRGRLLHVRIYPSEFGKKRMAEEDKTGPPAELFRNSKASKEDESDDGDIGRPNNGDEYDQDALRRYQLERLRYYYAIATFDSPNAAAHVYTELEGTELERSANLFDLSYVPEDMDFDEKPHEEATHDAISYQPIDFTTDALRHSNVKLTWDDDDPERARVTRRSLSKKEIDEMDFKALIASSDEEGEDNIAGSKDAQALRALLLSGNDENLPEGWGGTSRDKAGEMEITFTPGLSEHPNEDERKKTKGDEKDYETTLERYQRKEKEKKRAKKAAREEARQSQTGEDKPKKEKKSVKLDDAFFGEDTDEEEDIAEPVKEKRGGKKEKGRKTTREKKHVETDPTAATEAELSLLLDVDSNAKHFDMSSIMRAERKAEKSGKQKKRKRNGKEEEIKQDGTVDVDINLTDPRFKSLHEDHRFAIDPANPHFKKTKSMKKLLQAKGNRTGDDGVEREGKRRRRD